MKALVTGGTGFIGSHLVEALVKRGVSVRCLVREPGRPGWLEGLDVELVKGDCARPDTLGGAASGMDYVFHAAGITKAADPREYYLANAEGARFMAEAAARDAGGAVKFVYVSSQAAAGPSSEGVARKEDDPPAPVTDYGRSKLLGEKYVLGLRDRLNVAIVRPTSVYGPRDRDIYTFFKLVSRGVRTAFRQRRLVSLCYVDDLVEGIVRAAFSDTENGDAFFIAHPEPCDWDYMGDTIAWALGVKARRVVVPIPVLSLVALAAEGYAALTGRPALLNRQKMAEIRQRYWVADVGKARERLGFTASHDFRDGARLTAEWYRRAGWI